MSHRYDGLPKEALERGLMSTKPSNEALVTRS
jgi:hypothetical protein